MAACSAMSLTAASIAQSTRYRLRSEHRHEDLKISGEPGLRRSSFLPEIEHIFETAHFRKEEATQFLLQHVFAAGNCTSIA